MRTRRYAALTRSVDAWFKQQIHCATRLVAGVSDLQTTRKTGQSGDKKHLDLLLLAVATVADLEFLSAVLVVVSPVRLAESIRTSDRFGSAVQTSSWFVLSCIYTAA